LCPRKQLPRLNTTGKPEFKVFSDTSILALGLLPSSTSSHTAPRAHTTRNNHPMAMLGGNTDAPRAHPMAMLGGNTDAHAPRAGTAPRAHATRNHHPVAMLGGNLNAGPSDRTAPRRFIRPPHPGPSQPARSAPANADRSLRNFARRPHGGH
jgi:hypothetical protein